MGNKGRLGIWDFETVCTDLFEIARRAEKGIPRKTDAVLFDELVEIVQSTATWIKAVSAEHQTDSVSSQARPLQSEQGESAQDDQ